jgi:heme-degrading monooxygenase HmoA
MEHFDVEKSGAVAAGCDEQAERMSAIRERRTAGDAKRGGGAVIVRVWRAKIVAVRLEEYRLFEQERYMPMLHKQPALLGVLFLRQAEDHAASLTIWEDAGAVEALQSSPSYREVTHELAESALLAGNESVEDFEVESGDLRLDALVRALDRTRHAGP